MKKITFNDLLIEHDYYCSDSNYYSSTASEEFDTFKDFYDEMKECDVDWNLCFRFDITKDEDGDGYCGFVFIMQQRKGKFVPILINSVVESDLDMIIEYLTPHWNKLNQIWQPFSNK